MHTDRLATAEWANPEEFSARFPFEPGTYWLGRSPVTGKALGYRDDRHICLISGTRGGKGTTSIIPNLCTWPGSTVVVDPKGENATVTAAHRAEKLGQRVLVLEPISASTNTDGFRARFNPLDALDPSNPKTLDEAGHLADAIVVRNPQSKDPFWDESARVLVKGLILHVLTDPFYEGRRNLITVRKLIMRGDHEGVELLRQSGEANIAPAQVLLWDAVARNNAFGDALAGIGDRMYGMLTNSAKQFESVLQIASRNTEFLDSEGMRACVEVSDFELSDLKRRQNGLSVYLTLPQRYMGEHFRWLRMMITLIVGEMEAVPGRPATGHPVLMCLDEFAGLQRLEVLENAVAQIAGFGVKLLFVVQSLEQIKRHYHDGWETFLSNAGLKIAFSVEDHFTREYLSKLIGETELVRALESGNEGTSDAVAESEGSSTNQGGGRSDSTKSMPLFMRNTGAFMARMTGKSGASNSVNWSEGSSTNRSTTSTTTSSSGWSQALHKRPLITPDEIGRYFARIDDEKDPNAPGFALVLTAGTGPSVVCRSNYFEDPEFEGLFAQHPDHPEIEGSVFDGHLVPPDLIAAVEELRRTRPPELEGSTIEIVPTASRGDFVKVGDPIFTAYDREGDEYSKRQVSSPCSGRIVQMGSDTRITIIAKDAIGEERLSYNAERIQELLYYGSHRTFPKQHDEEAEKTARSDLKSAIPVAIFYGGMPLGGAYLYAFHFDPDEPLGVKIGVTILMLLPAFMVGGIYEMYVEPWLNKRRGYTPPPKVYQSPARKQYEDSVTSTQTALGFIPYAAIVFFTWYEKYFDYTRYIVVIAMLFMAAFLFITLPIALAESAAKLKEVKSMRSTAATRYKERLDEVLGKKWR